MSVTWGKKDSRESCWRGNKQYNLEGASAEHLVAADLLSRKLHVWRPSFEGGKHDLFFEIDGQGYTLQVKTGRRGRTGKLLSPRGSRSIVSSILALVWPPTKEIQYIAVTADKLPDCLTYSTLGE